MVKSVLVRFVLISIVDAVTMLARLGFLSIVDAVVMLADELFLKEEEEETKEEGVKQEMKT